MAWVYEGVLVAAVLLLLSLPVAVAWGYATQGWKRAALQAYLVLVLMAYFCGFWLRGGQTLAMKTWRLRLVRADGKALTLASVVLRFAAASLVFIPAVMATLMFSRYRGAFSWLPWLWLPLAATLLWAAFDRDGRFAHDRMSGTRVVLLPETD
jgi:uncharacterized RDD family membrane protein YckC